METVEVIMRGPAFYWGDTPGVQLTNEVNKALEGNGSYRQEFWLTEWRRQ